MTRKRWVEPTDAGGGLFGQFHEGGIAGVYCSPFSKRLLRELRG